MSKTTKPTRIQILCGCGWGNMGYEIEAGDQPECPICGHLFPVYDPDDIYGGSSDAI